jgi:hypothetical protein
MIQGFQDVYFRLEVIEKLGSQDCARYRLHSDGIAVLLNKNVSQAA